MGDMNDKEFILCDIHIDDDVFLSIEYPIRDDIYVIIEGLNRMECV
jgi:hypothetical protein